MRTGGADRAEPAAAEPAALCGPDAAPALQPRQRRAALTLCARAPSASQPRSQRYSSWHVFSLSVRCGWADKGPLVVLRRNHDEVISGGRPQQLRANRTNDLVKGFLEVRPLIDLSSNWTEADPLRAPTGAVPHGAQRPGPRVDAVLHRLRGCARRGRGGHAPAAQHAHGGGRCEPHRADAEPRPVLRASGGAERGEGPPRVWHVLRRQ